MIGTVIAYIMLGVLAGCVVIALTSAIMLERAARKLRQEVRQIVADLSSQGQDASGITVRRALPDTLRRKTTLDKVNQALDQLAVQGKIERFVLNEAYGPAPATFGYCVPSGPRWSPTSNASHRAVVEALRDFELAGVDEITISSLNAVTGLTEKDLARTLNQLIDQQFVVAYTLPPLASDKSRTRIIAYRLVRNQLLAPPADPSASAE